MPRKTKSKRLVLREYSGMMLNSAATRELYQTLANVGNRFIGRPSISRQCHDDICSMEHCQRCQLAGDFYKWLDFIENHTA